MNEMQPQLDAQEEVLGWMSLALDGLLDAPEQARLEAMMAEDAALRATWQQWQQMDGLLGAAVHAEPAPGFAERFAQRLTVREQRRLVRQRWLVGVVAVVGWLGTLAVLGLIGWFLFSSQTQWMNDLVRGLVYYPSTVGIWLRALRSSLSATIGAPQSLAMAACYVTAAAVLLSTWLWWLRRTTHEEVAS